MSAARSSRPSPGGRVGGDRARGETAARAFREAHRRTRRDLFQRQKSELPKQETRATNGSQKGTRHDMSSVKERVQADFGDGSRYSSDKATGVAQEIGLQAVRETAKEGRKRNAILPERRSIASKSGQDTPPSDRVKRDTQTEVPDQPAQL